MLAFASAHTVGAYRYSSVGRHSFKSVLQVWPKIEL
jgi:hypothetical protein